MEDLRCLKIVFACTNTLLLWLNFCHPWLGEGGIIPVGRTPYGELESVLEIDKAVSLDKFLTNGGTMMKEFLRKRETLEQYVFSSVSTNLSLSLKGYVSIDGVSQAFALAKSGFLSDVVSFVVKSLEHSLLLSSLENAIRTDPLPSEADPATAFLADAFASLLDKDRTELAAELKGRLLPYFQQQTGTGPFPDLGMDGQAELMRCLEYIGFVTPIEIKNFVFNEEMLEVKNHSAHRTWALVQPGVRWRMSK